MTKKAKRTRKTSSRKPKYLKNMVSVFIGRIPIFVKVRPATEPIEFVRELKHCEIGDEGECATCANSIAAMEAGIAPFMAFTDSRAVSIDKMITLRKAGYKAKCGVGRIWEHNQGQFQKKFDTDKAELLKSPDAVGTVVLRPYRTNKPGSGPKGKSTQTSNPKGVRPLRESPRSRKGSLKRAQRAGIFPSGLTSQPKI